MTYAINPSIIEKYRRTAGLVLMGVWALLLVLAYVDVLDLSSGWAKYAPMAVLTAAFPFFVPHTYHSELKIEGSRLRLGPETSYPIDQICYVRIHSPSKDGAKLKIRAHQMDTVRTRPVLNAESLIADLRKINPSIEVEDETANA